MHKTDYQLLQEAKYLLKLVKEDHNNTVRPYWCARLDRLLNPSTKERPTEDRLTSLEETVDNLQSSIHSLEERQIQLSNKMSHPVNLRN